MSSRLVVRSLRRARSLFRSLPLLQRFMVLCGIVLAAMAFALGQRISDNVQRDMVHGAAYNTALYVGSVVGSELERPDGTLELSPRNNELLDLLFSPDRLGAEIVAVKVWSKSGDVIYATEKELIGQRFPIARDLQAALAGQVHHESTMLEKEENAAQRENYQQLLEIYAPIRSEKTSAVLGASEIYQRVDHIPEFVASSLHEVWILMGVAFVVLYAALSGIVRDASKIIARQTTQLQQANKTLEEHAITDSLTHLYNHRYFHDRLSEEVERSSRYQRPLSLLFCDLDQFKAVNDTFGHQIGDLVLQCTARVIKDTLRSSDIAARYGGEEYAIILPDTDHMGATRIAERLRAAIEANRMTLPDGRDAAVTASIGIASLPLDANTKDRLIQLADGAMYTAKMWGRNRVFECTAVA